MVDFLVIGHYLSVGNINMFSLVKNRKICFGFNRRGMYFDGDHINCCWFQNLIDYCPEELKLKKKYKDSDYKKFDNYDAIYIEKSEDIPDGYYGVMGVPFVFLEKVNKNQFDIIGMLSDNCGDNVDVFNGEERYIDEGHKHFTGPVIDGRALYKRLLIKKK